VLSCTEPVLGRLVAAELVLSCTEPVLGRLVDVTDQTIVFLNQAAAVGASLSRRRTASERAANATPEIPRYRCGRVPHVCPCNNTTMIEMHTMHRESPTTGVVPHQAQPSQREGQGFEPP
jgi:hypothetical protein